MSNTQDYKDLFREEIHKSGLTVPSTIIADGQLHRFSSNGKSGDNAGWFILFPDIITAGVFGCWRKGFSKKWSSVDETAMDQLQRRDFQKRVEEAKKQRDIEQERNRTKAKSKAESILSQGTDVPSGHGYLQSKKIQAHGIKESKGKLVVPLYDDKNILHSLQFISADGDKKFLAGGRISGCYYPFGGIPKDVIYVAEGFATAATVHELTKKPVAVAFNAVNLSPVSMALRGKLPDIEIIICADDDYKTKGNPGISKAIEAAKASRSKVAIPIFVEDRGVGDTDFNDLFVLNGKEYVISSLADAMEPDTLQSKLVSMKLKIAIDEVKNGDLGAHLEREIIPEWRVLKQTDRAEFERLRAELKAVRGVNIRAFEDVIREDDEGEEANRQVAERLVELVNERTEVFHDPSGNCYATFMNDGHRECWSIESSGFKEWLSYNYYIDARIAPSETAQKAALSTIIGQAKFEGPERSVFMRFAVSEDAIWVDICDEEWRAIKITAGNWEVVESPDVMFVRTPTMRSLPDTSDKGDISPLWTLVNIPESVQPLVLCWVLECFRVETPYVLLEMIGEQGSAKSKTQDVLRDFIDPNQVNLRAKPKDRESLFVGAENSHLISYENLSHIKPDLQDAFCTLATGGGFAARTLYTNKEETIIEVKRPVKLNGNSVLVTAQDLLDRTVHIDLPRIKKRKTDKEIEKAISENKSVIWTGLLDIAADVLKILPSIKIEQEMLPRMADFAYLGEAVYRSLGKNAGEFTADYSNNRYQGVHRTINASTVASMLIDFIEYECNQEYRGTIGELFEKLNRMEHNEDAWPKSARGFGSSLRRLAPSLRTIGYTVELDEMRKNDGYHCHIKKIAQMESSPPLPHDCDGKVDTKDYEEF